MIQLIDILDYTGTFAFGLTGGIVAVEKKMDIVGILILSTLTGIGGGILRDLILGNTPPVAFRTYIYFILLAASGLIVFFFYRRVKSLEKIIVFADALGLGVFTVIGIEKGLIFKMPYFNCILLGIMTATFGGLLRDILANRVPFILEKEFYATACFIGGILFFVMHNVIPEWIKDTVVIIFITGLRIVAYLKHWNLPKAKT